MRYDADTRAPAPASPLHARRRAVTRQDIADAALELFVRQGYENTTVEQIADASGVSLRTFYRYCSSKDDALTSGLTTGPATLAIAVREHPELPFVEAVIRAFVAVSETEVRRRELRLIIDTPALRAAWLAAGREAQDDLIEVILERSPDSSPLHARARAAAVTGVLTMVIETWASDNTERLEPLTREALGVIIPIPD
jgi:AcrR family transcriptional regulator